MGNWVPVLRGEGRYLYATATPPYNANGEVAGAIESIRDITEQKQVEIQLRDNETRYRQLLEKLPVGGLVFGIPWPLLLQKQVVRYRS